MSFWQIVLVALGLVASLAIFLAVWQSVFPAAWDSKWLAVVLLGFIILPGAFAGGLVYGVWRWGNHGKF